MGIVYVLKLEAGRWYCGFTENLEQRTAQHFLGRGADWTRLWKPLSLHSAVEGDTELENAQTIALMAQYGWRKVRGGRYTSPAMSSQPKVLGSVLGRAVPVREPKPAFVDELAMGEAKVRFYRSLDGYSAAVGGVIFEGSTFGEVLGAVEESLGQTTERDRETETCVLARDARSDGYGAGDSDGLGASDGSARVDGADGARADGADGACADGRGACADGRGACVDGPRVDSARANSGQNTLPGVRAGASDPHLG